MTKDEATKIASEMDLRAKFGVFYVARPRADEWAVIRREITDEGIKERVVRRSVKR